MDEDVNLIADVAARRSIIGIAAFLGVHKMTAHRYMTRGNRYGVRLRHLTIGSTRWTCEFWARQFVAETQKAAELPQPKLGPPKKYGRPTRRVKAGAA